MPRYNVLVLQRRHTTIRGLVEAFPAFSVEFLPLDGSIQAETAENALYQAIAKNPHLRHSLAVEPLRERHA